MLNFTPNMAVIVEMHEMDTCRTYHYQQEEIFKAK